MKYFVKIEAAPAKDLTWNIPELSQGSVNVIGGNVQNFRTVIKVSEFLTSHYPVKSVQTVLPGSLRSELPELANLVFLSSTDSGSFSNDVELESTIKAADFSLLVGDFSKNSITGRVVASACQSSEKPLLITRDTVDLIVDYAALNYLMNPNLILLASMPSLRKLLQAVYYPKMLFLSQPLMQVVEVLHKFTLSYPAAIITLHSEQILIAQNGEVRVVPIAKSGYLPVTFWSGEFAAKVAALNLYNPGNFLDATIAAIFQQI